MDEAEALQQAHREINGRFRDMAAVAEEHGRGQALGGGERGTHAAGGPEAIVESIRMVVGLDNEDAVNLLLGGIQQQVGPAHGALLRGESNLVAVLTGLWVSGFAHGKRYAEVRDS